jgi:hypothetical protein
MFYRDFVTFGYSWRVKTMLQNGQLPSIKYDIYGDLIKKGQETVEHLIPHSKGGSSSEINYAIANKFKNNLRGSEPLNLWTTLTNATKYYLQFLNIKINDFDGTKYCNSGLEYIKKLNLKG